MATTGHWTAEARRRLPTMRRWRRALHREPELSNQEVRTRAKLSDALRGLGLTARRFPGSNGLVATIGPDRPGPVVALRADMDALPVTEATGLPYRSRFVGRMHACGHDVHMAALLGAASILQESGDRLNGPVKLLFQPAEEEGTIGGALPLLQHGAFDAPKVDFVVGQHVAPELPLGSVGWKSGPIMAAADHFLVTVRGTGGHAGYPHRGPDAIVVASEIVGALQTIVSRAREPNDPVVISVGRISGGTRHNILPEVVELEGTVRTLSASTRSDVERRFRRRVRYVAESLGASAEIDYRKGYPVTSNEPRATRTIVTALERELGVGRLHELERPVMGAEDFSRYLERVPGSFLFLGVGGRSGSGPTPHSPQFAPPDDALVTGATLLVAAAEGLQSA